MTAATETLAPDTLTAAELVARHLSAEQDRRDAEALAEAAKKVSRKYTQALETITFGEILPDEKKALINSKNPVPIPGSDCTIHFRDYGKPSLAKVLTDLIAWCGATKTIKVARIIEEADRLKVKHTKPSYKTVIK